MPWWRFWQPETEEELRRNTDQVEGIRALENGDIPPVAKRRIQEHLSRKDNFFSSDLSVREFLLCKEAGITPISQVMGTCNFNVSFFGSLTGRSSGELHDLSEAHSKARALALHRMLLEAELLGASGIIGVRIKSTPPDLKNRHSEFTAYGTAVSVPEYPAGTKPFTSTLNGQEFSQLLKSGYHPTGVIMGACSYYVYTGWSASQQMYGTWGFGNVKNQEIDSYTWGFRDARERAMSRLTGELATTDAQGVVDMQISHHIEEVVYERNRTEQRDLLVNFVALGTAIKQVKAVTPTSPLLCIDLRKGKAGRATVTLEEFSGP